MLNDTEVKVAAIKDNSKDATDKKKHIEKLEDLHGLIALKMNVIIVKVFFNLYQQILPPTLLIEWDNIEDKICFTISWLNDKGIKAIVKRGQIWDTLK